MREIDFLPAWYPQLRRQRRSLRLLSWSALSLVLGLGGAMTMSRGNELRAQGALDSLKAQVQQANTELAQMERLESLQKKWRRQAEVIGKLGHHVEASRLLHAIAKAMSESDGLALTELSTEIEETPVQLSSVQRSALKDPNNPPMERKLKVRLQGMAPTDVELATFLTELNAIPFFEQVSPTFVRDRRDAGHVLREFELTFSIKLTPPGGV